MPRIDQGRFHDEGEYAMNKFWTHEHEELIRTVDSIISIVFQILMLTVQLYGLHYIMTHSR